MSLARFSVKNRIFANLVFILGGVIGLLAFFNGRIDVYPDVSFDMGQIYVAWPGASPEEMESSVTNKIEDEILDIKGVERIVSSSERNLSLIDVKFSEDLSQSQFERSFEDLRAAVARVDDLPDRAERPVVTKMSVDEFFPLVEVVISGRADTPRRVMREVATALRERLRQVEGVFRVGDRGIPELEWKILVRRLSLEATGLTLLDVVDALEARHLNVPAGTLGNKSGEVSLTARGKFASLSELNEFIVSHRSDSGSIRLGEIATVTSGFKKDTFRQRFNGSQAITLHVSKMADSDSIDTRDLVVEALGEFEATRDLPEGITLDLALDATQIIRSRIQVLMENLGFGIVLVFLVLWIVLGARNSIIAIVGLPFSFLLALACLSVFDITINAITLFSLVLVSGMVVDDAIVVLENIYRKIERGTPLREAVTTGASEVMWPVVASTLTTLAAFLPMLIMAGVTGEFMSLIPKTVAAVLAVSLLECFVVLPAHYMHWGSKNPRAGAAARVAGVVERLTRLYERSLRAGLRRPALVLAGALLLAVFSGKVAFSLRMDLFPSDFQAFYCNIFLDPEYGLDATDEATREVEALLEDLMPERVESFTSSIGTTFTDDLQVMLKPHVAQMLVYIPDAWTRDHSAREVIAEVRRRADELVARDPQRRFLRIKVDAFKDGPPVGKPVAVRIASPDYGTAKRISRAAQAFLHSIEGVISISDNLDPGPRDVRAVSDPYQSSRAGVPFGAIGRLALAAGEGIELGDLLEPRTGEEVTLRLQLHPDDRQAPEDLLPLKLRTASGGVIPLEAVANLEVVRGPASRYHYDSERVVLVTADISDDAPVDSTRVNRMLMERFSDVEKRFPGVRLSFGGEFEETQKSFKSLQRAFLLTIILIYTILATQFRSYLTPLVVMVVVPFSFTGVVLGLWVLSFPFTIMAFIAIVGLSGVVVNDSLVLVDFIRRYRERGGDPHEALVEACRTRMRPVVLTTVTTVFGLLPMALGLSGYSPIWSPFAATITFGLSLAMLVTLYLVPSAYVLMDRLVRRS